MTSPCLSCATLAPCPCPAFLAWVTPAECLTCVDADWLIGAGESFANTAARLGMRGQSAA